MKVIGCCADLEPGDVVVTGHNREQRLVVIRLITEDEARASAASMGMPLNIVPGERFYEVSMEMAPVGGNN